MTASPLTSRLHRNVTAWFIRQRPSEITLKRRPKIDDGKGGFIWGPSADLPPQTMRKVASFRLSAVTERTSADGSIIIPTAALIGMGDADIRRYDRFFLDGKWHRVVSHPQQIPGWRTQSEIVEED